MRSLFLFLLLLNILYALWQLQAASVRPDSVLPAQELGGVERVSADSAGSLAETAPIARSEAVEEAPPAALCITLGVFAERREAEQLLQRLLALDVQAGLIEDDVVGSTDGWSCPSRAAMLMPWLGCRCCRSRASRALSLPVVRWRAISPWVCFPVWITPRRGRRNYSPTAMMCELSR